MTEFGLSSVAVTAGLDDAAECNRIVETGATWARVVIPWNYVEAWNDENNWSPAHLQWGAIDSAINAARARGLKILGLIQGPAPAWAADPDQPAYSTTPLNVSTYARFCAQVADRYRGKVRHWEIWNEPNLRLYWTNPDPKAYAALLIAASKAIKAVQPDAFVVSGGLSSWAEGGIAPIPYLGGMADAGVADHIDAVGLHPYTHPYFFDADPQRRWDAVEYVLSAGYQPWITEYGQPTGTSHISVDELDQADRLAAVLEHAAGRPGMGPIFFHGTLDLGADPREPEQNFGLYRRDGTPKPVVARLKSGQPPPPPPPLPPSKPSFLERLWALLFGGRWP